MPTTLDKYYLPHLRACEMLIGSLTAVWMQYRQQQGMDTGNQYAAAGALLSVCILFTCLLTYTEKTAYFPGPAAIIPCLAAAAFIYFNQFEHRLKIFPMEDYCRHRLDFLFAVSVALACIGFYEIHRFKQSAFLFDCGRDCPHARTLSAFLLFCREAV